MYCNVSERERMLEKQMSRVCNVLLLAAAPLAETLGDVLGAVVLVVHLLRHVFQVLHVRAA